MKIIFCFLSFLIFCTSTDSFPQSISDTINRPVQFRRGAEIPSGYQSYEEKYQDKNVQEEKRRLYLLDKVTLGTGIWTELNPKVPRVEYFGIHFINPDTGWAVGAGGSIIITLDGGLNWETVESSTSNVLLNVNSFNGQVVIATGYDGIIIRSDDGGNSWQQVISGVSGDLWRVQMLNDSLGWICGVGPTLLKTTDAGISWISVNTGYINFQYWSLDFYDENVGYIAGGYGNILKTTDGGTNWQHFDISSVMENSLYAIDVVNPERVFTGGFGRIAYTTNGGNSWTPVGISGTVNTIAFADSLVGYEGESEGHTWKTADGGISWQLNVWFPLYKKNWIMFVNDTLGYIAGNNLNVQKTTNKGAQWRSCIINDDFKDAYFLNKDTGWAVSDFNFYKTTDAGESWVKQIYPARARSLYFFDSLTGFAGERDNGKIYKTTNGGNNWYETITTGINGSIGKIIFLDSLIGFATNGLILKTTDGGENWQIKLSIPFTYFSGICFSNDSTVWAIGTDTGPFEIYKSTNKGENWIPINVGVQDKDDILFFNEQVGFFTGSYYLYTTTNGGVSFQIDSSVSDFGRGRFANFLNQSIFVMGNRVFVTTNGGEDWQDYPEVQGQGLKVLVLYEFNKGYAVGNTGIILKYFDENIPIEMTDFSLTVMGNGVLLSWKTITEKNNLGFEIERKFVNSSNKYYWESIVFVQGNGTTTSPHLYSYLNKNVFPGEYKYRLKQIDFDGSFEYSKEVEINIETPNKFFLSQNYPNPFNPITTITFQLPFKGYVNLKIYNSLGQEVETLVNEERPSGIHEINFDGSKLSSGVYIYRLVFDSYTKSKKLILIK